MKMKVASLALAFLLLTPSGVFAHGHRRGQHAHNNVQYTKTCDYTKKHKHNRRTGSCNYGEYCPNLHEYNSKTKVCNYGEDCPFCYR
ncbi:hypothetical protein [Anaerosphaera multitolerans]|uniref:hypothetical protein n=1 Tax=Anaerosphaera multitolerans TaxID=2487351 RepID=UPI000FD96A01|nr:hypothetical protein [Anaerosphaera multitolerans]